MTPAEVSSRGIASCFGMFEMEEAARAIAKWLKDNPYGWKGSVGIECMETRETRIGFVELVSGGWLDKKSIHPCIYPYNGTYALNDDAIDRIVNHSAGGFR